MHMRMLMEIALLIGEGDEVQILQLSVSRESDVPRDFEGSDTIGVICEDLDGVERLHDVGGHGTCGFRSSRLSTSDPRIAIGA